MPQPVYSAALHRFTKVLAGLIFLLIAAGALVTSNDAGLAVPDWPTSFGSLWRMPHMVGGVKFEHGHRMLAELVGLLTIVLAIWTWRSDSRRWMKWLGLVALGTVIAQGVLGGVTVLFFLPWWISSAHATLAQSFFCIVVSMALFSSRGWSETAPANFVEHGSPSLRTLSLFCVLSILVQLMLGAAFRHSGIKLLPHLVSAAVVTALLIWTSSRVLTNHSVPSAVRRPASALLGLLLVQLCLGLASYLTRVQWGADAVQPQLAMVISTVSHVIVGALLLATSVVLAIEVRRHILPATAPASDNALDKAVTA
ncbi:MAG: COX15/CtaA family protein [Terriglobales bacterium]|jgi:cytochrome c oxidase assembly protein subunit 15